ncbi:MAG: substrate-binding domain-containing protein, partial [Verrucomicrobiales bacterium]|nr:substrate-binding domain-containing protein [Verrucomicrobiales bacterium]
MVVVPPEDGVTGAGSNGTATPSDRVGLGPAPNRDWTHWVLYAVVGIGLIGLLLTSRSGGGVVLYCAQDQVFAEPMLAEFTAKTGIPVRPVFDSEAVKTVGLANRLLAERGHPVCDVYWGNEELRARQLAAAGVFVPTNGWAAFGHRSRSLVVRTNPTGVPDGFVTPRSLVDLTNVAFRGRVSLAFPLFGTTATHLLALRQHWGESNWLAWCRALAANAPLLEEGNSHVVRRVARGEAWVGVTDSDDIVSGQREGLPVAALPPFPESLLVPNTVALVAKPGGASPAARQLFEFLQSPAVRSALEAAGALESNA